MILADMPAPLVRVTASTLVPSDSAPKGERVAVAASALPTARTAADAIPRSAIFMTPPILIGGHYSGKMKRRQAAGQMRDKRWKAGGSRPRRAGPDGIAWRPRRLQG